MSRRLKGRSGLTLVRVTAKKQDGGIYQTRRWKRVSPLSSPPLSITPDRFAYENAVRSAFEPLLVYSAGQWDETRESNAVRAHGLFETLRQWASDETLVRAMVSTFVRRAQNVPDASVFRVLFLHAARDIRHPLVAEGALQAVSTPIGQTPSLLDETHPLRWSLSGDAQLMVLTMVPFRDEFLSQPDLNHPLVREYLARRGDPNDESVLQAGYTDYVQREWLSVVSVNPARRMAENLLTLARNPEVKAMKRVDKDGNLNAFTALVQSLLYSTLLHDMSQEGSRAAYRAWFDPETTLKMVEALAHLSETSDSVVEWHLHSHFDVGGSQMIEFAKHIQRTLPLEWFDKLMAIQSHLSEPSLFLDAVIAGKLQEYQALKARQRAQLRQHAPRAWELLEKTPMPKPRIKKPLPGG